ncbi:MAG: hypothetical protein IKR84_05625, partial [Oscillibacter sp.]|nr:hypothetical protein [Oscillibacter sp.]
MISQFIPLSEKREEKALSATIIDGRKIANEVYEELGGRIAELNKKGVIPRVAIVEVGDDEMSKRYVSLKENAAI